MWRIFSGIPRRPSRYTRILHNIPKLETDRNAQRLYETLTQNNGLVFSDAQRKTIYALSTPPGKGGVAIVRISGPEALSVWKQMVRSSRTQFPPHPWRVGRCHVVQPDAQAEQIDDGLAVYFKAPKSFTTEDVIELHLHSGRAVVSSVLSALAKLPYCRPAEPGEFTRRAFHGGRLDLTQVEGLQDLINADTEGQRRIALHAASGYAKAKFEGLRLRVIQILANVEALIDFGEGEDIEEGVYDAARLKAQHLLVDIRQLLNDKNRGEIIRSGIRLAIFGPTNAGKSSLLNHLAQRDVAIVTPVPGTTRDTLELSMDIGGLPVLVSDTAGLRKTEDLVESIGIERAQKVVQTSDISICVLSLPDLLDDSLSTSPPLIPPAVKDMITSETIILLNKSDLADREHIDHLLDQFGCSQVYPLSVMKGDGTDAFLAGFAELLRRRFGFNDKGDATSTLVITRARHRTHLESACRFLEAFLQTAPSDVVIAAEELRYAAQAIGKISGHIDVEDILDSVFRDFCIGK